MVASVRLPRLAWVGSAWWLRPGLLSWRPRAKSARIFASVRNRRWCWQRNILTVFGSVSGSLDSCTAACGTFCPRTSAGKTERRTQIGDLSLVQDEEAGEEAMRNGAISVRIMRFLLTIMVAADGAAATAVPGNDEAFTAGAYRRVTAADGAELLLFEDWPGLFQYYMMTVAVSSHVTSPQYKLCTSGTLSR